MFHYDRDQKLNTKILSAIRSFEPTICESSMLNGARFVSAITDSRSAFIALSFDAGSRREGPDERGALHFYEHLFPAALPEYADGLGVTDLHQLRSWTVKVFCSKDQLVFGFSVPDYESAEAMKILKLMMEADPKHYESVFEAEKKRILIEMMQVQNQLGYRLFNFVHHFLMEGTGYSHSVSGNPSDVSQYSLDNVNRVGANHLSVQNMTVLASGSKETVSEVFGCFELLRLVGESAKKAKMDLQGRTPLAARESVTYHELPEMSGVLFDCYLDGPELGSFIDEQKIEIGLNKLSRLLQKELSFKTGTTYSVQVEIPSFGNLSFLRISCLVQPTDVPAVVDAIRRGMDHAPELITDRHLEEVYIASRNAFYRAESKDRSPLLFGLAVEAEREWLMPSQQLEAMRSMNANDVQSFVKKYFTVDSARFVIHGSRGALGEVPNF